MERKLAAILAADVAGYSRAMGQDEAGTLAALSKLRRELIEPLVAKHRGRIFKLTGDGILVEFASVVDAVACAVAWQGGMTADGLQFRIGVNLGDVMHQDGDIYGNGVNVAARLEGLAEPGGICVSGMVQGELRGKLELTFEDLGEQRVKNIEQPVRVWRIAAGKAPTTPGPSATAKSAAKDKASVIVLPFTNMSGDPDQEYFSDGITEDIITELSRFAELLVIARNSSFAFKDKAMDVTEVGRTLGVAYVVEGSVRKVGNRVRITAQLVSAAGGEHVWAERYDRELKDIFELQEEVAGTVATTVAGRVKLVALDRARRRPTESLTAYDNYLRSLEFFSRPDRVSESEPFLLEAIRLDPRFALAHAMLSTAKLVRHWATGETTLLEEALAHATTALALDADLAWSNLAMGHVVMYAPQRFEEAGVHLGRAVAINPNDTFTRFVHAVWLCYSGRLEDAAATTDYGLRRDPYAQEWCWDARGIVLTAVERYEEAIASYHRTGKVSPWGQVYLAICHENLNQRERAAAVLAQAKKEGFTSIAEFLAFEPHRDPEVIARYTASLKRLGLPER